MIKSALILAIACYAFQTSALTLREQNKESLARLEKNLSHPDVAPGAVIASPSIQDPNYFFHWVRDAALVMESYVDLLSSEAPEERAIGQMRLVNWLRFESHLQKMSGSESLGEPKYNVDGSLFTGPWGRPQNDGPALRARTLGLWAKKLIQNGEGDYALKHLLNENGPLKRDLTYTMNHWREDSFDVWEEVKGDHFFTRLAQLKSVQLAAELFLSAGDEAYSQRLQTAAQEMNVEIQDFWNSQDGKIYPTIRQTDGWTHKKSNLDLTVLLASVYFTSEQDEFGVSDSRVISSVKKLKDSFHFYEINREGVEFLGRYSEDVYDGLGFSSGHPWFLANTGYAQFQCRLSHEWESTQVIKVDAYNRDFLKEYLPAPYDLQKFETLVKGDIRFDIIVSGLRTRALIYFDRLQAHVGLDGSMAEQFSRYNGFMRGARDLSWSHASFLRAANECRTILPDVF